MRGENGTTLHDLAAIVAERHDIPVTQAEGFLTAMFDTIRLTLGSDPQVKVKGLGTFKVTTVRERASVSVNTGERVIIDAHQRITFTPDASMRDAVNKPFAHFETVALNDGVVFDDITTAEEPQETQEPQEAAIPEATVPLPQPQEAKAPETVEHIEPIHFGRETTEPIVTEPLPVQPERVETVVAEQPVMPKIDEPKPIEPKPVEPLSQPTFTDSDMPDNNPSTSGGHFLTSAVAFILAVITLAAGITIGRVTADISLTDIKQLIWQEKRPVTVVVYRSIPRRVAKPDTTARQASPVKEKGTVSADKPSGEKPATAEAKPALTQPIPQPQPKPQAAPATPAANDAYTAINSDVRLRYGAYRIVGVETTVTVKSGQTLAGIARSYLGPGMDCYLEALNHTTDVKEGQKLKIPKLELKKKRKQQ